MDNRIGRKGRRRRRRRGRGATDRRIRRTLRAKRLLLGAVGVPGLERGRRRLVYPDKKKKIGAWGGRPVWPAPGPAVGVWDSHDQGLSYWYQILVSYQYGVVCISYWHSISYAGMVPSETRCYGFLQHGTMRYGMVLLIYQTESHLPEPYWYGTVMQVWGDMPNFGHDIVAW